MEGGAVGHNFEMVLPKDYPSQIWFNLLQYHSVVRWVIQAQWAEPLVLYRIRVAHLYSFLCFVLSSSCVLCAQCCQCLWSLNSWLPLWFSLTFIYTTRFVQQALHVDWCVVQETAIIYPGTVWIFNTSVNPPVLFTVNYFNLSNQIICSNVQRIILKEKKPPTNITTTSLSTNVKRNQILEGSWLGV
jgi:hypothetical protein